MRVQLEHAVKDSDKSGSLLGLRREFAMRAREERNSRVEHLAMSALCIVGFMVAAFCAAVEVL